MSYQLFNEDCFEGLKKIPDGTIEFALIDPPYGVTFQAWDKRLDMAALWRELERVLTPIGSAAIFASGRFTFAVYEMAPEFFQYKWVWEKNLSANFVNAKNRPLAAYEEILIFSKGKVAHASKSARRMKYNPQGLIPYGKTRGGMITKRGNVYDVSGRPSDKLTHWQEYKNYPRDVLKFNAVQTFEKSHPNQKPVELLEYLIRTYTDAGETVLDVTMGSGSTGVAAISAGRNFIGFELEPVYFEIARRRMEAANEQAETSAGQIELAFSE